VHPVRHETILALILLIAAWRALALQQSRGLEHWAEAGAGPETLVPDLANDDRLRLSWLPGVGDYRARCIVAGRPMLQLPLTPARLALIPGVGETTAGQVDRWYQRQLREP
jgi:hypothetical protein